MKVNLGVKPYIVPMPVLIIGTYNEDGSADAMNAAWGTLCDMNTVALYLSAGHKTVENIRARKAFTVAVADEANDSRRLRRFGIGAQRKEEDRKIGIYRDKKQSDIRTDYRRTAAYA